MGLETTDGLPDTLARQQMAERRLTGNRTPYLGVLPGSVAAHPCPVFTSGHVLAESGRAATSCSGSTTRLT